MPKTLIGFVFMALASSQAAAQLSVDPAIIVFDGNDPTREDIKVRNTSSRTQYFQISATRIIEPGIYPETYFESPDPEQVDRRTRSVAISAATPLSHSRNSRSMMSESTPNAPAIWTMNNIQTDLLPIRAMSSVLHAKFARFRSSLPAWLMKQAPRSQTHF